jgi:hypothetical protein
MGQMPMGPMMCKVTCEMQGDAMMMKMMPMDAGQKDMMAQRCDMMNKMMGMGMPMMMMCAGMPMMMGMGAMMSNMGMAAAK